MPTFASETTLDLTDRDAVRARIAERYERGDRVATIADQRERDARIATRYKTGEPVASIADSEAVDRPYVRAVAKRFGIPPRTGWQRRYPAARAWPRTPAQEARVFSAHMCRALATHGVVPRKTRRMRFSDQAAAEPAVWLGMFDGDGSGGPRRAAGRPRLDWYGTRTVMQQCSAFWGARLDLQTRRAPRVVAHSGGLSKVALYGSNAALAARILLDASPISMDRKRRTLEEIVHYRPHGRPVAGRSTKPRRPTWQPQI